MEQEVKWNGSEQVEINDMSPRSEGFTKLPSIGQQTCGKATVLLFVVLLTSVVLWASLLFLLLSRTAEMSQDLQQLQEKEGLRKNDSGILNVLKQLQDHQTMLKNTGEALQKELVMVKTEQANIKFTSSQHSHSLEQFRADQTSLKSQVLNENSAAQQERGQIQGQVERLWIELQRMNVGGWPPPQIRTPSPRPELSHPPGSICLKCPDNWQLFQKNCYYFGEEMKTWIQAKSACLALQGHLVIIHSKEEQAFLTKKATLKGYWIGLRNSVLEEQLLWVDSSQLDYTNWNFGEPNNLGQGEDCVMMRSNGKWNDATCRGGQEGWICEKLAVC
ncbi:LOW QUALITY PROTEIN: low affinity immunoglobulin epsilon Fc receptor [Tachyglossus aculeatus]|uniref:LOW QUALITY PROTEIN: low affinity immunoglobulin epsilon Fc receptor n=1 Tax=Tachyglossus aculeatus TaxID=9261 RepID=UPI0018F37DB8|nr:LOW QUALITY PROTEIN: low affinity immunoglobulin epsilon Fc receptor [Tachyglossus aculeatus]